VILESKCNDGYGLIPNSMDNAADLHLRLSMSIGMHPCIQVTIDIISGIKQRTNAK